MITDTLNIDPLDPRNIWISPDSDGGGMGTYDDPFASIDNALKRAEPGWRVVLMPGVYDGDLTVEISGDEKNPVYIASYKPGEAVIEDGCWYFYDTSDLVVSGLTFKNAKRGAISVIGQCLRNRFHSIKFVDCGIDCGDSCTFYFGGAGGRFNIIEDCEFSRAVDIDGVNSLDNINGGSHINIVKKHTTAGLMISDGGDGEFLMNHVVRRNNFCGYDRAIIVGTGNLSDDFESGHVVERNLVDKCGADGITVKCRDVQVRANIVKNCANAGINLDGGGYSVAVGNRIVTCGVGISASGEGHTVINNTIAACALAIRQVNDPVGLIADENAVTQEHPANDIADDCVSGRADDDDSYVDASMPDDTDICDDDGDEIEEIDILNYMFHLDERGEGQQ